MKQKIFTLLFVLLATTSSLFAESIKIGDLYYMLDAENQTAEVTSAPNNTYYAGDIIIPSNIDYESVKYSVISIGDNAFNGCTNLTSMDIPTSIINIGECAFCGSNISYLYVPTSVKNVGIQAFLSCKSVNFNAKRCNDLNEIYSIAETNRISLGDSVEYLPNYFYLNFYRSVLCIPKNLKEIGPFALENNIADFSIDANNEYFSAYCCGEYYRTLFPDYNHLLYNKDQTTLVKFGNAGEGTTKIKIPATVTLIADRAFSIAPNLASITCYAIQPPTLGNDALVDINKSSCKLYVPKESLDIYKSTNVWKDFFSIEAIPGVAGIEKKSVDDYNITKFIRNNQILILRGDKTYTVTGQEVQ